MEEVARGGAGAGTGEVSGTGIATISGSTAVRGSLLRGDSVSARKSDAKLSAAVAPTR